MDYNYRDDYGRQRGTEQRGGREDEQRGDERRGREERGSRGAYGSPYGSSPASDELGNEWGERSAGRPWNEDFSDQNYRRGRTGQGDYGQRDTGSGQGGWDYGRDEHRPGSRQGGYGGYGRSSGYGQSGSNDRGASHGSYDSSGYGQGGHRYGENHYFARPSQRRGKAPKGYKRTDERIKEDLYERLMYQDIDAAEVVIEVEKGIARLEGTVPERWMKHVVEDVADGCPGVEDVENRIRVQSQSGEGAERATSG